jgi:hypothetical protein
VQIERLTREQVGRVGLMYEVSESIAELKRSVGATADVVHHAPLMSRPKDIPIAQRLQCYLAKQEKHAVQVGVGEHEEAHSDMQCRQAI